MTGVVWYHTSAFGADISGADLSGDHFDHVDLRDAVTTGANLTSTTWLETTFPDGKSSNYRDNACLNDLG